jgi:TorA maturation chaperone TorD
MKEMQRHEAAAPYKSLYPKSQCNGPLQFRKDLRKQIMLTKNANPLGRRPRRG